MKKNSAKIAFCIPLFNEEKSFSIINRNINLILKILPSASFFFNDNHSNDKTYKKLLLIQKKWPNKIFIFRHSSNIGFSKNLSYFGQIADSIKERSKADYFQFLGADDEITKKGLRHLIKQTYSKKSANLIISNWIYTESKGKLIRVVGDFDNLRKKVNNSLEQFLANKCYVPGGIMQYCIYKDKLSELIKYENEISPHVGVFFSSFPGRVVCAGPPGLCRVRKNQSSGWRKTSFGVISTHVMCFEMYIRFYTKAYKEKTITKERWKLLMKQNSRFTWLIFKECKAGHWGKWAPTSRQKVLIFFAVLKGILQVPLFYQLANLRYLQKIFFKEFAGMLKAFFLKKLCIAK